MRETDEAPAKDYAPSRYGDPCAACHRAGFKSQDEAEAERLRRIIASR